MKREPRFAIDSNTDGLSAADVGRPLVDWLVASALPLWSTVGVDAAGGGFFEKIDLQRRPVEEPRRARVVARQIYVFATAVRRGWLPPSADALVEHGLRFLFDKMRLPDGTVAAAVRPDGSVVQGRFDLYEHAFVLFALAAASRGRPDRAAVLAGEAQALLACMRSRWAHPLAGFEEAAPRVLPLKSNPHMHLLEAALEWVDVSSPGPQRAAWQALVNDIVGLCLTRFIDADSGALHEYFDGDWHRMPGRLGGVVEPGHQFEWAWLLMRVAGAASGSHPGAAAAAQRLLRIGEEHGVDRARGVAVNELDARLNVADGAAKLWPQTERVKAWHAAATHAGEGAAADTPRRALADAVSGLSRYLLGEPAGLWHEQMSADGSFAVQDVRASSLYHIVCAIDTVSGGDEATAGPSAGLNAPSAGRSLA